MSDIQIKFGQRVRELRQIQGLTQEELAEKAELHSTYIGTIERGEQNLSLGSIEKVAKGLGVSIAELFLFCEALPSVKTEFMMLAKIIDLIKKNDERTLKMIDNILKEILKWAKEVDV
ncbi:MAG: helix-turn-helix transcriptional regulator [bacterium]